MLEICNHLAYYSIFVPEKDLSIPDDKAFLKHFLSKKEFSKGISLK
jgi:hypothetical protein